MKLFSLLPLLFTALAGAQTLPSNFETSLLADSAGVWVTDAQDNLSHLNHGTGAISTVTTGLSVSNASADYPIWRGVRIGSASYIPLARLDGSRNGQFAGFWKTASDTAGRRLDSLIDDGLPLPSTWAVLGDTAWGAADSSRIIWRLLHDTLSAWGLTSHGALALISTCDSSCHLGTVADTFTVVRGIHRDGQENLWIASLRGLWRGGTAGLTVQDTTAHYNVWPGSRAIIAQTDSAIWWRDSGSAPAKLLRGDTTSISGAEIAAAVWTGDTAWVLLQKSGIGGTGILRILQDSILPGATSSLYGLNDGLPFSEGVNLADIALEPATGNLWVASRGEGVAVRSGGIWTLVRHQSSLKSNLKEVRVFPTRLESGSSLIAYNLNSAGKVDIEVFNGAMEKVRTIISGEYRSAGQGSVRSESTTRDRWNGCDDHGHLAAIGLYYVRVKSGSHSAWGKVFQLKGGSSCD